MASELDRLGAQRLRRRDFMRYAGITAGAGVLAACKKATSTGAGTGASPSSRPPIGQEPGGLQVFDWSGYGNGDYYPGKLPPSHPDPGVPSRAACKTALATGGAR